MRRTRYQIGLLLPGGVWLALLYVTPIVVVVLASLGTADLVGRPIYGFNLGNYERVFQPLFLPVVFKTLLYATVTTAVCLLIGYPTAYVIARYGGRFRLLLVLTFLVPWFVDYLVRIYAWIQILADEGLLNGVLGELGLKGDGPINLLGNQYALIGGLVYGFLPFMILSIYVAVDQLDQRLIEAAKDLYGTPRRTFLHVTLPNTLRGVVSGCVFVWLLSLGDFATAEFLGGSQFMLGNLINGQFRTEGSLPFGAALTMTLLGFLILALLVVVLVSRRRRNGDPAGLALEPAA